MQILKKIGKWFLIVFIILNLIVVISDKTYLYKGLANTYLKGRSGPNIFEYEIFDNREVKAGAFQKWNLSKAYNTKTRLCCARTILGWLWGRFPHKLFFNGKNNNKCFNWMRH